MTKGHCGSYGLVMAMKNASENVKWSTVVSKDIARTDETVGDAYKNSCNGYIVMQKVEEIKKNNSMSDTFFAGYFPPFSAARNLNQSVPDWTTGWYVPSVREWTDMLGALGYLTVTEVAGSTNDTYTNTGGATIFDKVNSYMSKMGDDYYDPFASGNKYWTCSECSNSEANKSDAYYLEYSSSGLVIGHAYKQDVIALTRLVLGF